MNDEIMKQANETCRPKYRKKNRKIGTDSVFTSLLANYKGVEATSWGHVQSIFIGIKERWSNEIRWAII